MWDHPDREWNKNQQTSKEELFLENLGELFLKITNKKKSTDYAEE